MKILFIDENIDGEYIAAVFAGWYSNPTIEQLVFNGFTKEEAEALLKGETVEIEGIYGEFNLREFEEGYHYIPITHNRVTKSDSISFRFNQLDQAEDWKSMLTANNVIVSEINTLHEGNIFVFSVTIDNELEFLALYPQLKNNIL